MVFWLLKGGSKSEGTVDWYRSSYGTDFDDSEMEGPVVRPINVFALFVELHGYSDPH